jgi:hypothetical protein
MLAGRPSALVELALQLTEGLVCVVRTQDDRCLLKAGG